MRLNRVAGIGSALFALGLLACDSTNTGRLGVGISFSTKAPGALLMAGARGPSASITMTNGANTLVITKAQMVLRELELKLSAATTCATGTTADSCERVQLGPALIDLPVTAAVVTPYTAMVPAGTYQEIEFDIRRPGSDPLDAAFVAANPNFNNVSIRVEGTYNGVAFVFTSELDQEVQISFSPPLVVTEASNNATIAVDIKAWFTNSDGTLISPATAGVGQVNASIVAEKIKLSLRAFEDKDKSGS
jgi:hypothetical protein